MKAKIYLRKVYLSIDDELPTPQTVLIVPDPYDKGNLIVLQGAGEVSVEIDNTGTIHRSWQFLGEIEVQDEFISALYKYLQCLANLRTTYYYLGELLQVPITS